MKTLTAKMQPLRDEHDELLPRLETMRLTADRVGDVSLDMLKEMVDEVFEFLVRHLIPHAAAEDAILYPSVERVMRAPGAMATMTRDHVEIARLTEELGALRRHLVATAPGDFQNKALRRVLYGLYALVKTHFAKEEEILVPELEDGLSEEDAARLFVAMEEVAKQARERASERATPGSRSLPQGTRRGEARS